VASPSCPKCDPSGMTSLDALAWVSENLCRVTFLGSEVVIEQQGLAGIVCASTGATHDERVEWREITRGETLLKAVFRVARG
jgi:hypothetical protein